MSSQDKDKRRPGEQGFDPTSLYVPEAAFRDKTLSPFECQYWKVKKVCFCGPRLDLVMIYRRNDPPSLPQDYWDTILFFKKGKFYELYENDAGSSLLHAFVAPAPEPLTFLTLWLQRPASASLT